MGLFESVLPEPAALRDAGDATVVAAIQQWNQIEAMAAARRLTRPLRCLPTQPLLTE